MVQPTPPLCLSFLLAQPGICSSHTHLMQMPKLRNRERERESRRLCLLRKRSAASSAGLLKQGVCVREKARRVLHWEKSAFEEEKNRKLVERRIFCSYSNFFSLQRIVGTFFVRKKESIKGRVFFQTDEAVWRGLACTETLGCMRAPWVSVSKPNFFLDLLRKVYLLDFSFYSFTFALLYSWLLALLLWGD